MAKPFAATVHLGTGVLKQLEVDTLPFNPNIPQFMSEKEKALINQGYKCMESHEYEGIIANPTVAADIQFFHLKWASTSNGITLSLEFEMDDVLGAVAMLGKNLSDYEPYDSVQPGRTPTPADFVNRVYVKFRN